MLRLKQAGFSLIELMIAISLFAILASFAIPSYQQMIQNNKIRNAAESIHTGLQIARAEAVNRNANVQFDLRGADSAWTVCVSPAAPGSCPTTDDATTIQSRDESDGSDTGIAITESNTGPYVFNGFGVMTSPVVAAGTDAAIDVDNSQTTKRNLRVVIGVGGSVRVCDPALDTGGDDPRRCPA